MSKSWPRKKVFGRFPRPICPPAAEKAKAQNKKLGSGRKKKAASRQDLIPVSWRRKCQPCQTGSLERRTSCTASNLQNSESEGLCSSVCVRFFLAMSPGRTCRRARGRWWPTRRRSPCLKAGFFSSFATPSCSARGFCGSRHGTKKKKSRRITTAGP